MRNRILEAGNAPPTALRIFGRRFPFLEGILPQQLASAPSTWLSGVALIAAVVIVSGCGREQGSASGTSKATKEMPRGTDSKRAQYSQAPGAEKIDVNLLRLEQQVRGENLSLRQAAQKLGILTAGGGMMLDIVTHDIGPGDKHKFQLQGVDMRHFSPRYNRVSVNVRDLDQLYKLAALPEVRSIAPEYGAVTGNSQK